MKKHLFLIALLAIVAVLTTGCGSDDNNDGGGSTGGGGSLNSGKLEFPAPKGGTSVIITHTALLNNSLTGTNYSVEWDTEKSSQRWSCYKMFSAIAGSTVPRYYTTDKTLSINGQYPNDIDLDAAYRFTIDPYWSSGYDHGHICPSADRQRSTDANKQTFYMTNMQPQNNEFNAGIWATMELTVRNWTSKFDTLYVCKGGTIDSDQNIIEYVCNKSHQKTRVNKDHIPVPRFFFMAVLGRYKNTFRATGFWINQEAYYSNSVKSYAVTIGELQDLTGINFFHNLPDDIESQVENVTRAKMLTEWY